LCLLRLRAGRALAHARRMEPARFMRGESISSSSWPGLARPSTSLLAAEKEDVDSRDKPGHDEPLIS
jgi:hypothetical protein